ncbi:MAG: hypothetical protein ABR961_04245 [Thermoanaerobaculaceae bacterium]|jgi:hypothetical protein
MAKTLYLALSGAVFFLVAVGHLLRLAYGWSVVVGGTAIPLALSYVGLAASTGYCAWAIWLLRVGEKPR